MCLIGSYGAKKDRKIYGNCQVYSPDNILMFRCDEKRANWYLSRNLADVTILSPLTIRLKFQPKGLGNHNKEFGLVEMVNRCVNCGSEEYLTRHHVVPYCYRRYFPLSLKSHNFHDVLSMCVECHEKYERKADELKNNLSKIYQSPINGELQSCKELVKYVKIAKTLSLNYNQIPKSRLINLKKEIKQYFKISKLTKEKIDEISNIKLFVVKKTHGEIVINKIDNLQDFVEMWRKHFVDNNECKYLPNTWSVKTKIENE